MPPLRNGCLYKMGKQETISLTFMGGNENECTHLKMIDLVFTFSWLSTPCKVIMRASCAYWGLYAMNVLTLFLRSNISFKREQHDSGEHVQNISAAFSV